MSVFENILPWLSIVIIPFFFGSVLTRGLFSLSLQWTVGIFLVASTLFILHGLNVSKEIALSFIYFVSLIGLILYIKTYLSSTEKQFGRFISADIFDTLFYLALIILLIDAILTIDRNPLTAGDALAYWYQKAKALYYWIPLDMFPTLGYPHLGSTIWMFGMNYANGSENFGRHVFPILLLSIYVSYWVLLNEYFFVTKKYKFTIVLLFVYLIFISLTKEFGGGYTYVNSGYLDWLVGIVSCFSYMLLFFYTKLFNNNDSKFPLLRYFLILFLLACSSLIKSEGFVLVAIFIFSYFLILLFNDKKVIIDNRMTHFFGIIFLIFVATLYRQILYINGIAFEDAQGFTISNILESYKNIADRTPLIINQMIYHIRHHFDIILPFFILLCAMILKKRYFVVSMFLLPLFFHFMFVMLVFYSSHFDLEWHLHTALDRLMHQLSYMYIFGSILFAFILCSNYMENNE
jgi:hypothetical protein